MKGFGRPGGLASGKDNQHPALANFEKAGAEKIEKNRTLANLSRGEISGAFLDHIELNAPRIAAAQALVKAALNCGADAVRFLEIIHAHLSPDWPLPSPYANLMAEAREWARIASTAQRKGYALACFEALAPADQAAFLSHVGARAAA